jgi:hypothetical protein
MVCIAILVKPEKKKEECPLPASAHVVLASLCFGFPLVARFWLLQVFVIAHPGPFHILPCNLVRLQVSIACV